MKTHLTEEDLGSIRARAAGATPGPWCVAGAPRDFLIARHGGSERCSDRPVLWAEEECLAGRREDAEFMAQARSDIPRLLDEVVGLREALHDVLVWQLGRPFVTEVARQCPDRDLADEIGALFPADVTRG